MPIIYFLLSLTFLYLTKTWLTRGISRLIHSIGGNSNSTIIFWSIIFLPGTVIHEISHFLVAAATGARTGKIEILPEFISDDQDGGVALGSVETQKLNPIQGFLVGFAPFVSGLVLLFWLSSLILANLQAGEYLFFSFQIYLFFVIANSLFPSWSDIRQTLPLVAMFISAIVVLSLVGVSLDLNISSKIIPLIVNLTKTIIISSVLNLVVLVIVLFFWRIIFTISSQDQ